MDAADRRLFQESRRSLNGSPDRRLLFISSVGCPPPFAGNRTRIKTLLRELRSLGFEIHFAGVDLSPQEHIATLPYVDKWVADFVPSLGGRGLPGRIINALYWRFLWARFGRRLERRRLDQKFFPPWLAQAKRLQRRDRYDRVLVSYIFHSKFLAAFPDARLRILDTHDSFSNRREKLAHGGIVDKWYSITPREEARGLKRANRVIAIQDPEARYFRDLCGANSHIVGHFLENIGKPAPQISDPIVGFIGSDNPLNIAGLRWFFSAVWSLVLAEIPTARLLIAGDICKNIDPSPSAILLGATEKEAAVYERSLFMVNPIQVGTGLKIKTVEALSHGRAIVTTPVGAEGVADLKGILVTENAAAFSSTIIGLLRNPPSAAALGLAGLDQVQRLNDINHRNLRAVFD